MNRYSVRIDQDDEDGKISVRMQNTPQGLWVKYEDSAKEAADKCAELSSCGVILKKDRELQNVNNELMKLRTEMERGGRCLNGQITEWQKISSDWEGEAKRQGIAADSLAADLRQLKAELNKLRGRTDVTISSLKAELHTTKCNAKAWQNDCLELEEEVERQTVAADNLAAEVRQLKASGPPKASVEVGTDGRSILTLGEVAISHEVARRVRECPKAEADLKLTRTSIREFAQDNG